MTQNANVDPFGPVMRGFFDTAIIYPRTSVGMTNLGNTMLDTVTAPGVTVRSFAEFPASMEGPAFDKLVGDIRSFHDGIPIPPLPDQAVGTRRGLGLKFSIFLRGLKELGRGDDGVAYDVIGKPGWTPDDLDEIDAYLSNPNIVETASRIFAVGKAALHTPPALDIAGRYRDNMASTAQEYGELIEAAKARGEDPGPLIGAKYGLLAEHGDQLRDGHTTEAGVHVDGIHQLVRTTLLSAGAAIPRATEHQLDVAANNFTLTRPDGPWLA